MTKPAHRSRKPASISRRRLITCISLPISVKYPFRPDAAVAGFDQMEAFASPLLADHRYVRRFLQSSCRSASNACFPFAAHWSRACSPSRLCSLAAIQRIAP